MSGLTGKIGIVTGAGSGIGGVIARRLHADGRKLMVADVVEAMRSHRPYRPSLGTQAAIDEIVDNRGELYDPKVVDACVELLQRGFDFEDESF